MTNYKEILRLHSLGINNTRIAESCGCARSTVIARPFSGPQNKSFSGTRSRTAAHGRGRQEVVPFHCTGPAIQDARLRMGTPRDAEERRHPEPAVGGILRAVPSER